MNNTRYEISKSHLDHCLSLLPETELNSHNPANHCTLAWTNLEQEVTTRAIRQILLNF